MAKQVVKKPFHDAEKQRKRKEQETAAVTSPATTDAAVKSGDTQSSGIAGVLGSATSRATLSHPTDDAPPPPTSASSSQPHTESSSQSAAPTTGSGSSLHESMSERISRLSFK